MILSITTSNRPLLFNRTVSSLIANVQDIDLISKVILTDDGSPSDQVAEMTDRLHSAFPAREISIFSTPAPLGHVHSMQKLYSLLDGEYLFHCEDDWDFIRSGKPISESLDILQNHSEFCQVALSKDPEHYGPVIFPDTRIFSNTRYWTYNYEPDPVRRYKSWPHFTLTPSIINLRAIRKVGDFRNVDYFEYDYALRWMEAGFRTAFLHPKYAVHIGTNGQSAYKINGTPR